MYPPPPEPEPYLVAVLDLLGYKSHLWEDSGERRCQGLSRLYETYYLLLHAAGRATKIDGLQLTQDGLVISINEAVSFLVASDTVMLWATKAKGKYLVAAVARLLVGALQFGAPLRGALAYGDCIFDAPKGILIGYPIVEAVEAEKRQNWIGVGVLQGASANLEGVKGLVSYGVPVKPESPGIHHALAWHWAEEVPDAAVIYLERNRQSASPQQRVKYDNALAFVQSVGPARMR